MTPRPTRVVTLGGGHGQAAVLAGLAMLDCDITAIVSVADDGGCSGLLRREHGMPPPGDIRRCLSTLALDRTLAERFERRVSGVQGIGRSVGNLMLREAYERLGSLQAAADWAASRLSCRGRVVPVSEEPGRLVIYDRAEGLLHGETTVARRGASAMVVNVLGVRSANPAALEAIRDADLVVVGPGSFITSTLAVVMTGDIAAAIVAARATPVLMHNLVPEPGQTEGFTLADHLRLWRDHLCIKSGSYDLAVDVMRHGEHMGRQVGPGGESVFEAPLADRSNPARHAPGLVAAAFAHHYRLGLRPVAPRLTLERATGFDTPLLVATAG